MSKAILVMDMPSRCEKCDLQNFGRCEKTKKSIVGTPSDLKSKPDWCPLNPIPETKEEYRVLYNRYGDAIGTRNNNFNTGYNACIDEILGGSEE